MCRRRQRYTYVSVVERLCTEKAGYITLPRCKSSESFTSRCSSVAALALASCNEHVAEENVSRPHPLTSRVLCTVPTQCSKLERSEKQLNFLVREIFARGTCISMFPGQCTTRSFLHFPPPRPFSPACSPPPSCFFARALQSRAQRDRCCARVVARLPHLSGNKPRRQNWAKDHNKRAQHQFFCPPPHTPPSRSLAASTLAHFTC